VRKKRGEEYFRELPYKRKEGEEKDSKTEAMGLAMAFTWERKGPV